MYNLKLATFGLMATAALPTMAYLPPHKRSESAVDLGTLESLEKFYEHLGLDSAAANWEAIEELETHDFEAIAAEDAARAASSGVTVRSSPAATPDNMGLAARQDADQCADQTGFAQILCANMPSRTAWWTAGGAMAIWYTPDLMIKFADAIAHVVRTARSLRQVKPAGQLGARAQGPGRQFKFSVPVFREEGSSPFLAPLATRGEARNSTGSDAADMQMHNNFHFDEDEGVLHYMGTRAALAADEVMPSARRGTSESRRRGQTKNYTIVVQATALTSASTIASEQCIGSVIKYHINRATEQNRFRCVGVDNRGSWKVALHVNVNRGRNNGGEYGTCCEF
ncbi:uncharacterized protein PG986_001844 [Apiospora aurea]|uniref:Uncharacterized protein n=1 Tax=Apiospora aurea TaxID=335848 RepID=A0ABR1QY02_9PEZI